MLNKLRQENVMLLTENQSWRTRYKALQESLESAKDRNCDMELKNQRLTVELSRLKDASSSSFCVNASAEENSKVDNEQMTNYVKQIEDLRFVNKACRLFMD